MVVFEQVTVSFNGRELFSPCSFVAGDGELVCVAGASGCGKSSLLKAVVGVVPVSGGSIDVDGVRLSQSTVHVIRMRTAWMGQEQYLPYKTVWEMLRLPYTLKAARGAAFPEDDVPHMLDALGLERGIVDKNLNEISGGQRQKVNIIAALLQNRKLVILDEPVSALDDVSVEKVVSLLRKERDKGKTLIAASHDAAFIGGCDKVVVLEGIKKVVI